MKACLLNDNKHIFYLSLVHYLAVEHHLLTHRGYVRTLFTCFLASPSNKWGKTASVCISSASSGYIFAFLTLIREKMLLVLEWRLCNKNITTRNAVQNSFGYITSRFQSARFKRPLFSLVCCAALQISTARWRGILNVTHSLTIIFLYTVTPSTRIDEFLAFAAFSKDYTCLISFTI